MKFLEINKEVRGNKRLSIYDCNNYHKCLGYISNLYHHKMIFCLSNNANPNQVLNKLK